MAENDHEMNDDDDGLHSAGPISNGARAAPHAGSYGNSRASLHDPPAQFHPASNQRISLRDPEEIIGLEAGAADQRAVDIGDRHQFRGVRRLDRAAIEDPDLVPGLAEAAASAVRG